MSVSITYFCRSIFNSNMSLSHDSSVDNLRVERSYHHEEASSGSTTHHQMPVASTENVSYQLVNHPGAISTGRRCTCSGNCWNVLRLLKNIRNV